MDTFSLADNLQRTVEDELAPGEVIRWLGQPVPRSVPGIAWIPCIFAVPWTLFSLFWMAEAAGIFDRFNGFQGGGPLNKQRLIFSLFGLPFVLIGLGMLSSPLWIWRRLRRRAERTAYVITNQRAI